MLKKNENIKGDIQVLLTKQTEMETNLDSVQRDKRQIETDRTNAYDELQKIQQDVQEKQDELNDLQKSLGDQNSGTKELLEKIKGLTEAKVKLEAKGKSLDEDSRDKKILYDNEVQKGIELERVKAGLDDGIKDLTYKLQSLAKEKGTLEQKSDETINKLKDMEKRTQERTR